eukprot:320805-Hanusia_phi.AAC.1
MRQEDPIPAGMTSTTTDISAEAERIRHELEAARLEKLRLEEERRIEAKRLQDEAEKLNEEKDRLEKELKTMKDSS